jgi:hypothetical protein
VLAFCFNSQFFIWENIYSAVGSEKARGLFIIGKVGENCESKLSQSSLFFQPF